MLFLRRLLSGLLTNVNIQLEAVASAAAFVRIASGVYSAGSNHAIASKPTAKKKLNRNNITVATIPAEVLPSWTVPARMAMQHPWPTTANSINFRRPKRSMVQIGTKVEKKSAKI